MTRQTTETSIEYAIRERELVRKLDKRLLPFLSLLYLFCFLDRVNIGNARLMNMESDLQLTHSQYYWSLSIFFIPYVLFEIPSNLLMKSTPPNICLSRIIISWGICSTLFSTIQSYTALLALRILLGICEAGFFPGVIYYLSSYWYKRDEIALRIALFFGSATMAGAFGGVVGWGISWMDGWLGVAGWRWMFIVEGLPTVFVGVVAYFYLPVYESSAKSGATGKKNNWLSESERVMCIQRLCSTNTDNNTETDIGSIRNVLNVLLNVNQWLFMITYIGILTPLYSISFFLPTIVNGFGYWSPLESQLMSTPPYIVACLFTLYISYSSDSRNERSLHLMLCILIYTLGFILLSTTTDSALAYIGCFITLLGLAPCIPICLGWFTDNVKSRLQNAVGTAAVVGFGNLGGLGAGQLYRQSDAPFYRLGHGINVGFGCVALFGCLLLRWRLGGKDISGGGKRGVGMRRGNGSEVRLESV